LDVKKEKDAADQKAKELKSKYDLDAKEAKHHADEELKLKKAEA